MAETFEDRFNAALVDFINRRQSGSEAVKVIHWAQELPSDSYCETCGPDPITVDVQYQNAAGTVCWYSYYGELGELIRELT